MTTKQIKDEIEQEIFLAFFKAHKAGIKIVVASDEEANSFNVINPVGMIAEDTRDNCIALAVSSSIEEDEIFTDN